MFSIPFKELYELKRTFHWLTIRKLSLMILASIPTRIISRSNARKYFLINYYRIVNITSQQREEYINQLIDNPSFKGTLILGKYKVMHRNYLNRGMEQITICKEHLMSLAVVFYTPKNFYLNE